MKELSAIDSNIEYQRGYYDGFREGMNKAMEYFRNEMLNPKPIQILVGKDEFETTYKSIYNAFKIPSELLDK